MSDFFWTGGHLGWGFFSIVVSTGLWLLLADLYWRLKNTRIRGLLVAVTAGWIVGVGLILLACYIANW